MENKELLELIKNQAVTQNNVENLTKQLTSQSKDFARFEERMISKYDTSQQMIMKEIGEVKDKVKELELNMESKYVKKAECERKCTLHDKDICELDVKVDGVQEASSKDLQDFRKWIYTTVIMSLISIVTILIQFVMSNISIATKQ